MKWIILFLSFFFLITHELVPHRHHEELNDEEHQKEHETAENVLDFFSLVFHQNLGSHHLQEMVVTATEQSIPSQEKCFIFHHNAFKIKHCFIYSAANHSTMKELDDFFIKKQHFRSHHPRRGPPVG